MTKILVDGGAAINIMLYIVDQKLGKGDQDVTKTNKILKDFDGNVSPVKGAICVELTIGSKTLPTTFFVIMKRVLIIFYWGEIGFMPIAAFHLQCTNAWFSG